MQKTVRGIVSPGHWRRGGRLHLTAWFLLFVLALQVAGASFASPIGQGALQDTTGHPDICSALGLTASGEDSAPASPGQDLASSCVFCLPLMQANALPSFETSGVDRPALETSASLERIGDRWIVQPRQWGESSPQAPPPSA
ncbi:MAG: hypothetical protein EPN26_02225 [Rhodospirillales bacterium]|nr:MAG: hypothetical protein EPN26_02225 [Rhodospirillales bacterium]